MYENVFVPFGTSAAVSTVLILGMIWTLAWKGWALWLSARKGHKIWFVAMLILSTLGILPILYIFVFSKLQDKSRVVKRPVKRTVTVRKTNRSKRQTTRKATKKKPSTKKKTKKRK